MRSWVLAALDLQDVFLIAAGLILGLGVVNTFRWVVTRRRRVRLPEEFLLEMNRFVRRFERSAEQMRRLSKLMEHPTRLSWKTRNAEIVRTLREMNRLLQHLNDFFEEKIQDYETPTEAQGEVPARVTSPVDDFSRPEEKDKFRQMRRITKSDITATDWDALLKKLNEPGEDDDRSD